MALTDQELLILNNIMYMTEIVDPAKDFATLGEFADYYLKHPELLASGDKEAFNDPLFLQEIIDNPKLRALGMGEATPMETDCYIRGRCFVEYDEAGNVVGHVVAFRGTGGYYEAWGDNFDGLYMAETEGQRIAREYVESLPYDDITITGHSKGGNAAMYCTATLGDKIERCVSFDGQGFGEEFYAMISKEDLKAASEKITSISAHNDYVNILLTPFAGTNMCVPNAARGFKGAHSPWKLYESNVVALEANEGYFTESMAVDRDLSMELIDTGLEAFIRFCPEDERDLIVNLVGSLIANKMGKKNATESKLYNSMLQALVNYMEETPSLKGLGIWGNVLGELTARILPYETTTEIKAINSGRKFDVEKAKKAIADRLATGIAVGLVNPIIATEMLGGVAENLHETREDDIIESGAVLMENTIDVNVGGLEFLDDVISNSASGNELALDTIADAMAR